jgi:hypothetical protein
MLPIGSVGSGMPGKLAILEVAINGARAVFPNRR